MLVQRFHDLSVRMISTRTIGYDHIGLDVIENEFGMYYFDRKSDILDKRDLYILRGFPNVIVTPHMAFYTDQAISDMVKHSLEGCLFVDQGKANH